MPRHTRWDDWLELKRQTIKSVKSMHEAKHYLWERDMVWLFWKPTQQFHKNSNIVATVLYI